MSISTGSQILAADINNKLANDGWKTVDEAFAYTSAVKIKLDAEPATIVYSVGDKIRFKQSAGTWKYGYIVGITSGLSPFVLTLAMGTSYTVVNEAITDLWYSKAATPVGFPGSFAWSGASGINPQGFSSIAQDFSKFHLSGIDVLLHCDFVGTSNATTMTGTLPITPAVSKKVPVMARDNNTDYDWGLADIVASNDTITFYRNGASAAFTNSNTKGILKALVMYPISS